MIELWRSSGEWTSSTTVDPHTSEKVLDHAIEVLDLFRKIPTSQSLSTLARARGGTQSAYLYNLILEFMTPNVNGEQSKTILPISVDQIHWVGCYFDRTNIILYLFDSLNGPRGWTEGGWSGGKTLSPIASTLRQIAITMEGAFTVNCLEWSPQSDGFQCGFWYISIAITTGK
jgi:hypothetical protein